MAWYERAQVGDRVVCIEGAAPHECANPELANALVVGRVYVITELDFDARRSWRGCHVYLGLAEVSGLCVAVLFKPVRSTDTGMAILRGLLQPAGPLGAPPPADAPETPPARPKIPEKARS